MRTVAMTYSARCARRRRSTRSATHGTASSTPSAALASASISATRARSSLCAQIKTGDLTDLPVAGRAVYNDLDATWGADGVGPVVELDTVEKKAFYITEDNDGGGSLWVFDSTGDEIASGSYSESESFTWD